MNVISEKLNSLYLQENLYYIDEMYNRDLIKMESILGEGFFSNLYDKFKGHIKTPEKQNKLVKSNTIDKLKKSYRVNIKLVKDYLLKQGVDVARIKKESVKVAHSVKQDFEKQKSPQIVQEKLFKGINTIVVSEIASIKSSFVEKTIGEKISASIIMFLIVLCINTIFLILLSSIFGSLAYIIVVIIIAPIIEETAKRWAISQNHPWVYTGVFAGLELLQYVFSFLLSGANLIPTLIIRISALIMHFSTTAIQKYFYDKDVEENNLSKDYTKVGYILAIFIHVTWNLIGTVFDKELSAFVGI